MNDDTSDGGRTRTAAKVLPLRRCGAAERPVSGADDIERRILENEELVQLILDSEKNLSPSMTIGEFKAWLAGLHDAP